MQPPLVHEIVRNSFFTFFCAEIAKEKEEKKNDLDYYTLTLLTNNQIFPLSDCFQNAIESNTNRERKRFYSQHCHT